METNFERTNVFLTPEQFDEKVKNSKIATAGGYYYKKLLIDPVPALNLWTQDDMIESYLPIDGKYNLIRSVSKNDIKSSSIGQGTLTIKVNNGPMFNLLIDESFREQTLQGMKDNLLRDAVNVGMDSPLITAATTAASVNETVNYFKGERNSLTNAWKELLKNNTQNTTSATSPGVKNIIIAILIAIVVIAIMYFVTK